MFSDIFPTINISKLNFRLVICIANDFIWTTLFLHRQIPDFQIVVFRSNMMYSIHQQKAYLFSFQVMYKSQFPKIDPYEWFCGPGSHMELSLIY